MLGNLPKASLCPIILLSQVAEAREGHTEAPALLMAHVGARTIMPVRKSTFSGCLLKNLGNETKKC